MERELWRKKPRLTEASRLQARGIDCRGSRLSNMVNTAAQMIDAQLLLLA